MSLSIEVKHEIFTSPAIPQPQVIKAKTTDPNVTLNADKVIRAAQVGTLPEREAVRLGETSFTPKWERENLGKIWGKSGKVLDFRTWPLNDL